MVVGQEIARCAQINFPDSCSVVIFDAALDIIYHHECTPTPRELLSLRDAFGNKEAAIQSGILLAGRRFEIHRHHPPLVYGRQMGDVDPEDAAGIAAYRIENSILGSPCYAAITYRLPNTSAHMATSLRNFCEKHLQATQA